jgi:hypothetical protein
MKRSEYEPWLDVNFVGVSLVLRSSHYHITAGVIELVYTISSRQCHIRTRQWQMRFTIALGTSWHSRRGIHRRTSMFTNDSSYRFMMPWWFCNPPNPRGGLIRPRNNVGSKRRCLEVAQPWADMISIDGKYHSTAPTWLMFHFCHSSFHCHSMEARPNCEVLRGG